MKGRVILYSPGELAWIKAHSRDPRKDMHAAFCVQFGRSDVTPANINALCKRKGWLTGRTGQFALGQVSHNAGKKGHCAPGSEKGWFKKGNRTGAAQQNYQPIGTERRCKDGYLERKIHDGMPMQFRWRAVHLVEWEAIHGPVPKGMALKCLDGDRTNTNPANWEAIPRAMLPRLNGRKWSRGYDTAPNDLKPVIMAVTKLEHALRETQKADR